MKAQQHISLIRVFLIAFPSLVASLVMSGQTGTLQNDSEKNTQAISDLGFQRTYQNFSSLNIEGNMSFADMDNDGDLDIIYGPNIYINNNGYYPFIKKYTGDKSFSIVADLDNDNEIDLVTFYRDEGYPNVRYNIRLNPTSSNDSIDLLQYFGISDGYSAASDFNNDGLQDLSFMVFPNAPLYSYPHGYTTVYRNENSGTTFTEVENKIYDNAYGSFDWGDYDNDYDNDLLVTGLNEINNKETNVLINKDASFSIQDYNMVKMSKGNGIWSDYDCDGDLDIILSGENRNLLSRIYRNDGTEGFHMLDIEPMGLKDCEIASGDLDNDGDVDIIMAGTDQSDNPRIHAYINIGKDEFDIQEDVVYVDYVSSIDLGDYDSDGDLDLLTDYDLFRNTIDSPNKPPSIPGGMSTQVKGTEVRFHWKPSSDDMTLSSGLSYNLRVGTTPGGNDVFCPPAINGNSQLKIPGRGNVSHNIGWQLKDLPAGTYYWSVQAIDAAYACSDFASEGAFTTSNSSFTKHTEFFEGLSYPFYYSTDVGDYDLDGDYDLILSHGHPRRYTYISKTYFMENTFSGSSPAFNFNSSWIPEFDNSSVKFCDLDNDEDLDLIISGRLNDETLITDIYKNDYPNPGFQALNAGMKGLELGSIDFGDFDNDGDYDILLTGRNADNLCQTCIYRNEDMTFVEIDLGLMQLASGDGRWLDLNNDRILDIVLSGIDNNGQARSAVYFGDSHSYSSFKGSLKQLSGDIDYADIDNDGFLEFVIAGVDSVDNVYVYLFEDYREDFALISNEVVASEISKISFGDIDVDGKHDLLISGAKQLYKTDLYSLSSEERYVHQLSFAGTGGSIELFDLDNDMDQDIYLAGYSGSNYSAEISYFVNNFNWGNTRPSAPGNPRSERNKYGILLEWDPSSDTESIYGGLSYNVRVGTSPGANDILSPMADASGKRYIQKIGNAQMNHSFFLDSLVPETYYWSVQAIDQSYLGSAFSTEESFNISVLGVGYQSDTVCMGTATSFENLSVSTADPIESWKWDFGDGNIDTSRNPKYIFNSAGSHNVTLWAFSTSGDSASFSHEVLVKESPEVLFDTPVVCDRELMSFTDLSILGGLSGISYNWGFGDNETSTTQSSISHLYSTPGTYEATLTISANNGCIGQFSQNVTVAEYPDANISLEPGYDINFCSDDSTILAVPDNASYRYQWQLNGVNILGETENAITIKGPTGEYSVQVENPLSGCISEGSRMVTVRSAPAMAEISIIGTNDFCERDSAMLYISDSPGMTYQWLLNGGEVGNDEHTYFGKATGIYTCERTNEYGCTSSSSNGIDISVTPGPAIPVLLLSGPTIFCEDQNLTLDISNPGTDMYQWLKDDNPLGAENGSSLTIDETGHFMVRASNGACVSYSQEIITTVSKYPVTPVILTENYEEGSCQGEEPITLKVETLDPSVLYQWKRNGNPISGANSNSYTEFLAEGEYLVEAKMNGCGTESEMLTIEYGEMPEKPEIIVRGPVVWYLVCSTENANEYRWYYNKERIQEADEFMYVAGNRQGRYEVAISVGNSCYSRSEPIYIPLSTGIEETLWKNLNIYPNPTPGVFTLEMDNPLTGELIIDIFNGSGGKVVKIEILKESAHFRTEIDLSTQPSGVYLINLVLDRYRITRSLVVE